MSSHGHLFVFPIPPPSSSPHMLSFKTGVMRRANPTLSALPRKNTFGGFTHLTHEKQNPCLCFAMRCF